MSFTYECFTYVMWSTLTMWSDLETKLPIPGNSDVWWKLVIRPALEIHGTVHSSSAIDYNEWIYVCISNIGFVQLSKQSQYLVGVGARKADCLVVVKKVPM
jgi:hypothetical protein